MWKIMGSRLIAHRPCAGLGFVVRDFVAKATGKGDIYQQGWQEASADKAAAFEKWEKFQRDARRQFGLQSGQHVQWHIGAAVAQQSSKFRRRFPIPPTGSSLALGPNFWPVDPLPASHMPGCHARTPMATPGPFRWYLMHQQLPCKATCQGQVLPEASAECAAATGYLLEGKGRGGRAGYQGGWSRDREANMRLQAWTGGRLLAKEGMRQGGDEANCACLASCRHAS